MSSHGIARAAVARCTCRSAGDDAMYPPREGTKAVTVLTLAKNYFEPALSGYRSIVQIRQRRRVIRNGRVRGLEDSISIPRIRKVDRLAPRRLASGA